MAGRDLQFQMAGQSLILHTSGNEAAPLFNLTFVVNTSPLALEAPQTLDLQRATLSCLTIFQDLQQKSL